MTNNPLPQIPDMFPEIIAAPKFKRGDVVHLNSAPYIQLTVVSTSETVVGCTWMSAGYEQQAGNFLEDCLTLVTP